MMIKYILVLVLILQLSSLSLGHLCLFDPPQRIPNWELPLGPGDNACFQTKSNCGNTTAGEPTMVYNAGSTIEVFFQQNYNHWYTPKPGFLDIAISYSGDNGPYTPIYEKISDYNAWDMVTQTNYTVPVTLPTQTCKNCVLRVRYISNNKAEPDFYQCSDIAIVNDDSSSNN